MSKFVLSFRAATDRQPDADQETAWTKWFEQIGGSVAEWGHRVGQVRGLGTAKGSSGALAGYLVIEADDFSAAVSIAEGCPGLRYGGGESLGPQVGGSTGPGIGGNLYARSRPPERGEARHPAAAKVVA